MRPSGKWFVMSKKNSIDFVNACKREGIVILGIEAFYLRENGIQPSMDNSIDYTSQKNKNIKDVYSEAINFLNQSDESMHFEIVCPEEE